jgi:hypothetical protein
MSQSLNARFNGNSREVVQYARDFGILATMEEYQVKDYIAMLKYLKEHAPDETFQTTKVDVDSYAGPDAFDKFCEAMLRKYSKMESANKVLADEIAELKRQVDYYKANKWRETRPVVQAVLEYCEEK